MTNSNTLTIAQAETDQSISINHQEEIRELRCTNQRLANEMAYMGKLLGDDGTGHVPTLLAERLKEWDWERA